MKPEYEKWIKDNVKSVYCSCLEVTEEMRKKFPELIRVRGHYHCVLWGRCPHWWLITAEGEIIDPTASQFPSRGAGYYEPWDESKPEPTGKCLNCGDYCYNGEACCSDQCGKAFSDHCSMTEKTLETQFSDLINTHRKLGDESSLNNEIAYNRDWRTAVTSALSGDDKIDKGVAVEIVENLKNHLTYAEDWRNAVTDALLDAVGHKISQKRAVEIIKDLKNQKCQTQEQDFSVTLTPYFRKVTYDDVIEFLKKQKDQQAEIDILNKQLQEYENKLDDLLEVLSTANDHLNKITTRRSQTTSSQNRD